MHAYEHRIRRVRRPKVAEALAAYGLMRGPDAVARAAVTILEGADREHFLAFHCDARGGILGYETIAIGCLTGVEIHPREVFRGAIAAGAANVIAAHNHPSGDPAPSSLDIDLTRRLRAVGEVIGIPLVDHVVIGNEWLDGHASIAELIG